MANENGLEPIDILLSREELLFVLNLLQAEFIPGLETGWLRELNPEQWNLALAVAGRALQARELARLGQDGQWSLHNDLLRAVGTCAYAQSALLFYHWPRNQEVPTAFFGHIRAPDVVVHVHPEEALHRFSILPSKAQLIDQALAVCQVEERPVPAGLEMTVSHAAFVQAREFAVGGDPAQAADLLVNRAAAPPPIAQTFVEMMAAAPQVSIAQMLNQDASGAVQQQDLTLLQNGSAAWLILAPPGADNEMLLQIKTTTKQEIQALLTKWL